MINKIIGGFITLLVGAVLVTEISNSIGNSYAVSMIVDESEIKKYKRQTYLDYVKERLEVERLMKK